MTLQHIYNNLTSLVLLFVWVFSSWTQSRRTENKLCSIISAMWWRRNILQCLCFTTSFTTLTKLLLVSVLVSQFAAWKFTLFTCTVCVPSGMKLTRRQRASWSLSQLSSRECLAFFGHQGAAVSLNLVWTQRSEPDIKKKDLWQVYTLVAWVQRI